MGAIVFCPACQQFHDHMRPCPIGDPATTITRTKQPRQRTKSSIVSITATLADQMGIDWKAKYEALLAKGAARAKRHRAKLHSKQSVVRE